MDNIPNILSKEYWESLNIPLSIKLLIFMLIEKHQVVDAESGAITQKICNLRQQLISARTDNLREYFQLQVTDESDRLRVKKGITDEIYNKLLRIYMLFVQRFPGAFPDMSKIMDQ